MPTMSDATSLHFSSFLLLLFLLSWQTSFMPAVVVVVAKSTIEPCASRDSCPALLGYTLYTDLKVSEVAALFHADPLALLASNAFDAALPGVANRILPAGLFLRVPTQCACADGIRKSLAVRYRTRPADTLASIAGTVFAGLASADQIREANGISDPSALEVGQSLVVPLPCTCFNSSDDGFPAVYLSYVVLDGDTVPGLAARYSTTVADIMNANSMGSPVVRPGDILAIPLPACASMFLRHASDFGMILANGTYAITAGHCVQCSCEPGNLNLYCTPAPLAVSCSSMQCRKSNLIIGNATAHPTSSGCNVTSCNYGGFVNGSIVTELTTTLQPQCPGHHQLPSLIPLPTTVTHDFLLPPSPSPVQSQPGGIMRPAAPRSSLPGTFMLPSLSPAAIAPAGIASEGYSFCLPNPRRDMLILGLVLTFLLSMVELL